MDYTTISEGFMQLYEDRLKVKDGFKPNWAKIRESAKEDPAIFAKYFLGIVPFVYQYMLLLDKSKRIAVCSSRQIGKTWVVVILALFHAMYNPNSSVLIFSKSTGQAKKFLREMKKIIFFGQQNLNQEHSKHKCPFKLDEEPAWTLPEEIDDKKPNNTEEFTLTNGSVIRSLPPTDSSRGYTGDLVIVDEAAFVPDEIFDTVIEPTVRFTGGRIVLLSTPNGQKGFFYHYFDPEDKRRPLPDDETPFTYSRYWWDWTICPNEEIKQMTMDKKKDLDPIRFAQEYEAKFTSTADAFFQQRKIEEATDDDLPHLFEDKTRNYTCGIDYGMTKSRTVITLSYLDEEHDEVRLAYQREYPGGYDNNNLRGQIEDLESRFNIFQYVVDDCPQGQDINFWLEGKGKNVIRIYFGRDKIAMFWRFKSAMNKRSDSEGRKVRFPFVPELISQMQVLQQRDNKRGSVIIEKPIGGLDDRIDSFVLSTYPYLIVDTEPELRSYLA